MNRIYFTKEQAHQKIGNVVESLTDFPSVPTGTKGVVVKAQQRKKEQWELKVRWKSNESGSYFFSMVGDVSINLPMKAKAVTDVFCKSEYESLVKPLNG